MTSSSQHDHLLPQHEDLGFQPRLRQRIQSATWRACRPRTPDTGSKDRVLIELNRIRQARPMVATSAIGTKQTLQTIR